MTARGLLLFVVLSTAFGCAHRGSVPEEGEASATSARPLSSALSELHDGFERKMGDAGVKSAAMAVVLDGRVVLSDFIGQVDPFTGGSPQIDEHTLFRLASLSKLFTGVAILRLRDQGKLSLDDPLSKYVPEIAGVVYPQGEAPPITLRQLLTHASGLPHDLPGFWELDRPIHEAEALAALKGLELRFTPGSDMAYSNLGLGLLGLVVQRVSGRPYRDYLRDDVLIPIGMTDAAWGRQEAKGPVAVGVVADAAHLAQKRLESEWQDGDLPGYGGLYASLSDMEAFARFELGAWPPRADAEDPTAPLRRSTLRESQGALGPTHVGAAWFAGWRDSPFGGFAFVDHAGSLPGYRSFICLIPHKRLGLILLTTQPFDNGEMTDFDLLSVVAPAVPDVAMALNSRMRAAVDALLAWLPLAEPSQMDGLFTPEFIHDAPPKKVAADLERARRKYGACSAAKAIVVGSSGHDAAIQIPCERGVWRFEVRASDDTPPKIRAWFW